MATQAQQKVGPTPGPWIFGPEHAGNEEYSVVGRKDGQGVSVALVVADEDVPPAHGEMLSNARLIAAAPDLLSNLQYVESACDWTDADPAELDDDEILTVGITVKALRDIRAALAKAQA